MSETVHAIAARRLFDGLAVRDDAAVLIEGKTVAAVVPRSQLSGNTPVRQLPENAWLAPGFIDLQVNGGGDLLFNDAPTPATIRAIAAAHRRFGTTALLPTLISDSAEKMAVAMAAVESVFGVEPGVLGVHLEGPFLSRDKAGVHDPDAFRSPDAKDLALLTAPREGVTLMTLAPEQVPAQFIAQLVGAGVHVALGHSMATYAQTKAAMAAGLTGFTHLFNAMRPPEAREPGPVGAALESPSAWYGLIVDGVHVAPATLKLALRGAGRPILVTDAMPPVGGTRGAFKLGGETIVVRDGRCARADGRLAGSVLDMAGAVRNCVRLLNVPLPEALRFAATYPAEVLGLGQKLGKLLPGFRADMVAFDGETIKPIGTWVAGSAMSQDCAPS